MRSLSLAAAAAFLAVFALALALAPATAGAQPLKTWGNDPVPPLRAPASEPTPTPTPTLTSEVPSPPRPPVAAPPGPKDRGAPPDGESRPSESPGIVHGAGRVGLRYVLEGVEIRGNTSTLAHVIQRFVPFRAGDTLDVDDKELLLTRYRLLSTGFFRDVQLSLRRGTKRGQVILQVDVVERNTIVVNDLWLGLSADAEPNGRARPLTAYGGIDVSETNLAGTGVALGGAIALADRQLALRTRVSDPDFVRTGWAAEAQLLFNNAKDFFGNRDVLVDDPTQKVAQDYAVVGYQRFGGLVGLGHGLGSVATRLFLDYRIEKIDAALPVAASHLRGLDVEPIDFFLHPGSSVLSTVSATVVHDTRDEPFLPTHGWHVLGLAEASLKPLGSDYPYTKLVLRASRWMPVAWDHVLRIEGVFGGVFGNAPLYEKFYVGDYTDLRPHRALDLAFDRRAAPNFLNTSIAEVRYGDYAARVTAEYRIPLYRGRKTIYGVDVFGSGGFYAVADGRDITNPARGYHGFSKVPIDLTFNLGLRADTAAGGFSIGLANLIGFIPIRSGTQ